jgi:hypothetical protein
MPKTKYQVDFPEELKDDCHSNYSVCFTDTSKLGFPIVQPYYGPAPQRLVPYHKLSRLPVDEETGIHFYLDDYRFETVWQHPKQTIGTFIGANPIMLGPDFSTFTDWPLAVQQYNVYRSRWICALWQTLGVRVIPTVTWSDQRSWEWAFDALPSNSIVSVSSVGTEQSKKAHELFIRGFWNMYFDVQPSLIVFYGSVPEEIDECQEIVQYETDWQKLEGDKNGNSMYTRL